MFQYIRVFLMSIVNQSIIKYIYVDICLNKLANTPKCKKKKLRKKLTTYWTLHERKICVLSIFFFNNTKQAVLIIYK